MDPKIGDRISLDAKKVGQPRRAGVVRSVTKGISGIRCQITWDDGSESVIAPGAGVLLVEGRATRKPASKATKPAKSKAKNTKAKSAKPKAPKAKAKSKKARSTAKSGKRR